MLLSSLFLTTVSLVTLTPSLVFGQQSSSRTSSRTSSTTSRTTAKSSTTAASSPAVTASPTASSGAASPPDVYLTVPTLSVGRIELDVDDLQANINLNAQVANLVTLNAGVAVSIQKVNLTIADVDANLELTVRLGHLVEIVSRVFESLDLNPSLISGIVSNVTSAQGDVVGAVDGLLGTITQGGNTLNFLVDNLGNVVQEVNGVSTIVGSYLNNMTETGVTKSLSGGLIQKQYNYSPLNSLVDIVFNSNGQVVQATVEKATGSGGGNATRAN